MTVFLVDNKPLEVSKISLPLLVHGANGSGGSFLSIKIVENLLIQGNKLTVITGFEPAKERLSDFASKSTITFKRVNSLEENYSSEQLIIVNYTDYSLFFKEIMNVEHRDRILFIKNFDLAATSTLTQLFNESNQIVLQGNCNMLDRPELLMSMSWHTKILFDSIPGDSTSLPRLEKYKSFFQDKKMSGVLSVRQT